MEKAKQVVPTNTETFAENISETDLNEAGPSKTVVATPKDNRRKRGKANRENYTNTDYESDSSKRDKNKARTPRKVSDAGTGARKPNPGNEQRYRIICEEIRKHAMSKVTDTNRKLEKLYATANPSDDIPMRVVMAGSYGAVKNHWINKYTEQRQAELDACSRDEDILLSFVNKKTLVGLENRFDDDAEEYLIQVQDEQDEILEYVEDRSDEEPIPTTRKSESRRRPATVVKTLTSSDIAKKYNLLLDKRLQLLDAQHAHMEEENALIIKKRKLEVDLLEMEILSKNNK
ncbi:hypothetical protein JTB14_018760 [Gonioctena quinquepunctata]|nr:hypothetical protein JTB14_018760 [Gonioctena quinquepunctata]